MRLPRPFYRLPLQFDSQRLLAEVQALPVTAWFDHPNQIDGNSSVRLISVEGGENDDINGVMRATSHLLQSPYLRQILASFGVVWGRSRLMRLAPGAQVPPHADINYHWFNRVRLHIPIVTQPEVQFFCGDENVHMASGEAWLFDNWRLHRVINPTRHERIHFVADTSGSAAFWRFARGNDVSKQIVEQHRFDLHRDAMPLMEAQVLASVMHPSEIEMLILDLRSELSELTTTPESALRLARYHTMLESFCLDWRQLYLLHGDRYSGRHEFTRLRDSVRAVSRELGEGLCMRSNRVAAHTVFEARVLRVVLVDEELLVAKSRAKTPSHASQFDRPIFIVAAPRSGSTLLFESLAASKNFATLGGEAHWLVEGNPRLQPNVGGSDSNRLDADAYNDDIGAQIIERIRQNLRDSGGHFVAINSALRFLEKTPKNSLRIPFFNCLFPDARFIFLWRDPRENLSSIIEAWRSGRWKTYNGLDGFDGPWSLLLPPGWRQMNGKSLEEIAAFQWETTNRILLEDLSVLPRERWTAVSYADFLSSPKLTVQRLCAFLEIEFDAALQARVSEPLPLSKYTHTPPASEKWRTNEALVLRMLPALERTWQRLKTIT